MLDLQGVTSLLDLGGGSGVVSFALLRKQHDLTSVVLDVENVCRVGQEIASEIKLERRITYLAADLLQDDIPTGFDMVMLCDVGLFSEILFRKIYDVLNLKGRFVIVDKFALSRTSPPPSRLTSVFLDSLKCPEQFVDFTTTDVVQHRLQLAGYQDIVVTPVPPKDNLPWNIDWVMLEARM
jgi:cyclopropane fatty-acyl-phospholipid synthase-like methyltransferase